MNCSTWKRVIGVPESHAYCNLALISDLLPQKGRGGDLALYRLLGAWPSERLAILYSAKRRLEAAVLPATTHATMPCSKLWERGRHTRFNEIVTLLGVLAPPSVSSISRGLGTFAPDAVLTVAHDFVWLTAAKWCRESGVPLHVIIHDDWPQFLNVPSWARPHLHKQFAAVLRQAATRLCVSQGMAAEYENRYGVKCDVLLPCRGPDSPEPVVRAARPTAGRIVVAYLGGLPLAGYSKAIRAFAELAQEVDGLLYLYGDHSPQALQREGLVHNAIIPQALIPWAETYHHLFQHARALFCPVSFQPRDAAIMRTLFPSKLADYTACGLPIIIWGPEESSAVAWARAHDHAAFICTDPAGRGITAFLQQLLTDEDLAVRYARGALLAGEKDFSLTRARSRLSHALSAGSK